MSDNRFVRYLHELTRIERYRLLKPWHHLGRDRALFTLTRTSVARGVALGFFFSILTPVAQILFAIVGAVLLGANILVAAGSTLLTNPFLMPFVYYLAYRVGLFLTTGSAGAASPNVEAAALHDIAESEEAAARALDVTDWFPTLLDWATSVGVPLLIGVVTLAVSAAAIGYFGVYALWGLIARCRAIRANAKRLL